MNALGILFIVFLIIAIIVLLCWCVAIVAYNEGYKSGFLNKKTISCNKFIK